MDFSTSQVKNFIEIGSTREPIIESKISDADYKTQKIVTNFLALRDPSEKTSLIKNELQSMSASELSALRTSLNKYFQDSIDSLNKSTVMDSIIGSVVWKELFNCVVEERPFPEKNYRNSFSSLPF